MCVNPIVSNTNSVYSRNQYKKRLYHYNPVGDPFRVGQVKSTKAMSATNRGATLECSGFYQDDSLKSQSRLRGKRGENYDELLVKL